VLAALQCRFTGAQIEFSELNGGPVALDAAVFENRDGADGRLGGEAWNQGGATKRAQGRQTAHPALREVLRWKAL
jgi:hypothetical protein